MSHRLARRGWPTDLALVVVLVGLADAAFLVGAPRPVEWLLAVPFLVVLPGYVAVSTLLPGSPAATDLRAGGRPGWPVRAALSLALSVAIVGVVGVALSETVGIRLVPAVFAISATTVGGALVASLGRLRLPPEKRANPLARVADSLPGSRGALSPPVVALGVALVFLVGAVAFAGATPSDQQPYTEFYVLAENESGELVADGYPETFVAGEGRPLSFAIENEEHRARTYHVFALAQPDGSAAGEEVVDRFSVRVEGGERAILERQVTPTTPAGTTRLRFLLYEGSAPAEPDPETADASLRLWVEVVPGAVQ